MDAFVLDPEAKGRNHKTDLPVDDHPGDSPVNPCLPKGLQLARAELGDGQVPIEINQLLDDMDDLFAVAAHRAVLSRPICVPDVLHVGRSQLDDGQFRLRHGKPPSIGHVFGNLPMIALGRFGGVVLPEIDHAPVQKHIRQVLGLVVAIRGGFRGRRGFFRGHDATSIGVRLVPYKSFPTLRLHRRAGGYQVKFLIQHALKMVGRAGIEPATL